MNRKEFITGDPVFFTGALWPFIPKLMTPKAKHDSDNFAQKWFPGVHSNAGGGYPDTGRPMCAD